MSKTLFWYIFRQLIWIFFLASGALAGMMSFGGLLRPLTRQGLGLSEVGATVANLMPIMCTYAFPLAVLFATTLVYGRLASDNELVAMRAGGISHRQVATPAIALGFLIFGLSLYMLCFVVPASTLRFERVLYTNVARILATDIERKHEFQPQRDAPVLSAQGATILPPDPNDPSRQAVVLDSPLIINSERINTPEGPIRVPKEFHTARKATVYIRPLPATDEVEIVAQLDEGVSFPRRFANATTGGVEATQFGPIKLKSQLTEKTKFMDLRRLRNLYANPDAASRVREVITNINELLQSRKIFDSLEASLQAGQLYTFGASAGERHTISAQNATFRRNPNGTELTIIAAPNSVVRYETIRGSNTTLIVDARQISIRPTSDETTKVVNYELRFEGAVARAGLTAEPVEWERRKRPFTVNMSPDLAELGNRSAATHRADPTLTPDYRKQLDRALLIVNNEVIGELNARAAFAVSCFVLTILGACLGMMFRSGHFLTAFGVSVAPALLCILLTTTGQHTLENVPVNLPPNWTNPIFFGTSMIWAGNVVVGIVSLSLLYRLQRQ